MNAVSVIGLLLCFTISRFDRFRLYLHRWWRRQWFLLRRAFAVGLSGFEVLEPLLDLLKQGTKSVTVGVSEVEAPESL